MTHNRLPAPWGRLIDRDTTISFQYEGRPYKGYEGDTLSSALLGAGRFVLSRSFKYHRARGVFSLSGSEANSLVQLPDIPNVPGDTLCIAEGLSAKAQNVFGSLDGDKARVMDKLSRFLPVGFYYHTFFKPRGLWPLWEKVIRAMAGLGYVNVNLPDGAHHDFGYDKAYTFCDVAVVGAGVSGLTAALQAANAGAEVHLIESMPVLGGSLLHRRGEDDGANELISAVENHDNITVFTQATAQGLFADNLLAVTQGKRLYKLRAGQVVVATGSIGQPAVFAGNDIPGVMHVQAAQRLLRLYGVKPGRTAMILTADDDGYACALDLLEAGVEVAGVVDLRETPNGQHVAMCRDAGINVHPGAMVLEAKSGSDGTLNAVRFGAFDGQGRVAGPLSDVACDVVCVSVGVVPNGGLIHHRGTPALYDETTATFKFPDSLPDGVWAAGGVNGYRSLVSRKTDGVRAGLAAVQALGLKADVLPDVPKDEDGYANHPWPMTADGNGKAFVDFDEDLQYKDIVNAVKSGFSDVQLLKRYSTAGMGPMQGRTGHLAVVRISANVAGRALNKAGMTTLRPPIGGETLGHLAGRQFDPTRFSAAHDRHVELGADMMVAGAWLRPAYYPKNNETADQAIAREVTAVRTGVGLIDISTLGKLEVRGPDAAEFMNRMYTFAYLKQPVGRLRYALMCGDAGQVVDDGVAARLGDEHFYVSATTGGVDAVYRRMLWFNAQWRMKVDIANVTGAYAAYNVAGPDARNVLQKLNPDFDISTEAMPYMGAVEGVLRVNGENLPVRALRVGFVGELGYELHCPVSYGLALWDGLMAAGADFGVEPFGVEAQRALRLEKGHIIVGQDTDGLSTPIEADMPWAIANKKPFYVGKAAVDRLTETLNERRLVGFALKPGTPKPKESHLVIKNGNMSGRVTSISDSPTLGHPVGLAFVAPDQTEPGTDIHIRIDGGNMVTAQVVALPFYDPDGNRQEM